MDECKRPERTPEFERLRLTPMIDVTFLLLIFFLLACRFQLSEGQIEATLPKVVDDPPPVLPVLVTLRPAGGDGRGVVIEMSDRAEPILDVAELAGLLRRRIEVYRSDEVPVVIRSAGPVRWEHVVNAFNQG
ncbi:hypothetical protein LCGC14_1449200, partial [marine sediment metagenome]